LEALVMHGVKRLDATHDGFVCLVPLGDDHAVRHAKVRSVVPLFKGKGRRLEGRQKRTVILAHSRRVARLDSHSSVY
jgi:hypothetical protein